MTVNSSRKEVPVTNKSYADLLVRREEAGRRYVSACEELRASIVELAALERLLPPDPLQTFEASPPDALPDLRHRGFLTKPPSGIRAAVKDRVAEILAAEVVQ